MMDLEQFYKKANQLPRYLVSKKTALGFEIYGPEGKLLATIPVSKSQRFDALTLLELVEALPDIGRFNADYQRLMASKGLRKKSADQISQIVSKLNRFAVRVLKDIIEEAYDGIGIQNEGYNLDRISVLLEEIAEELKAIELS